MILAASAAGTGSRSVLKVDEASAVSENCDAWRACRGHELLLKGGGVFSKTTVRQGKLSTNGRPTFLSVPNPPLARRAITTDLFGQVARERIPNHHSPAARGRDRSQVEYNAVTKHTKFAPPPPANEVSSLQRCRGCGHAFETRKGGRRGGRLSFCVTHWEATGASRFDD